MPDPTLPDSWLHHLLTDAVVMGGVTWVGFAGTALGLAIALWQLAKVKTAAEAAANAAHGLTKVVHSRERLLELSSARDHLNSAKQHLAQPDFSKATIFLEIARTECLQVKEMLVEHLVEQRAVQRIILQLTKLIENMSNEDNLQQADTKLQRFQEAREIADTMEALLVRLRYRIEYKGEDK